MIGITTDKLAIYLQDHLAGATFGLELARRLAAQNEGTSYGPVLEEVAREIDEDRTELETIMQRYGVGGDTVKNTLAWAGEKAGRFKLNGQLRGYSPLSRVLELDGLMSGVRGKLALWVALQETGPAQLAPAADLAKLEDRARSQLDRLQDLHREAAREAFGARRKPSGEPARPRAQGRRGPRPVAVKPGTERR